MTYDFRFPIREGERVKALDGPNKGETGEVLFTPDIDGPWYEIRTEAGKVIVSENVEREPAP